MDSVKNGFNANAMDSIEILVCSCSTLLVNYIGLAVFFAPDLLLLVRLRHKIKT